MLTLKRRVFNLMAVLSLAMCVASVALWVRSYWYRDYFQLANRRHAVALETGQVWIIIADRPYWAGKPYQSSDASKSFLATSFALNADTFDTFYSALGFTYVHWVPETKRGCVRALCDPLVVYLSAPGCCAEHLADPLAAAAVAWRMPSVRLRSPRHPRPLPRVRNFGGIVRERRISTSGTTRRARRKSLPEHR